LDRWPSNRPTGGARDKKGPLWGNWIKDLKEGTELARTFHSALRRVEKEGGSEGEDLGRVGRKAVSGRLPRRQEDVWKESAKGRGKTNWGGLSGFGKASETTAGALERRRQKTG